MWASLGSLYLYNMFLTLMMSAIQLSSRSVLSVGNLMRRGNIKKCCGISLDLEEHQRQLLGCIDKPAPHMILKNIHLN